MTKECTTISPENGYKNQNAIFFATVGNLDTPKPLELSIITATRLAMDEIARNAIGVPGAPDGGRRPLTAVLCNGGGNDDAFNRAVDHVIDNIGVQALHLGSVNSDLIKSVASNKTIPKDVFLMTSDANDSTFAAIPDKGLLWENIGDLLDLAPPYKPLLTLTESKVRQRRTSANTNKPVKVALVVEDFSDTSFLAGEVARFIVFNGKTVQENGAATFLNILIQSSAGETKPDYTDAVLRLKNFAPDIVIAIASAAFDGLVNPEQAGSINGVLPLLESAWPTGTAAPPRPYYLGSAFITSGNIIEYTKNNPGLEKRVSYVTDATPLDKKPLNSFVFRYLQRFPPGPQERDPDGYAKIGAGVYDTTYLLSLAYAANASEPTIKGPNLSKGMEKIGLGTFFEVEPTTIGQMFATLATGASVLPNGTTGPLTFDSTGSRKTNASVFCFSSEGKELPDVVRYDEVSKTLTGTFNCYDP